MNKNEYIRKRQNLLSLAKNALNEGNLEEFEAKKQEVEKLDADYQAQAKAQADLDALKNDQSIVNLENMSNHIDGSVKESMDMNDDVKKELTNGSREYEVAWAKRMQNMRLSSQEEDVISKVNAAYTHTTENTGIVVPETVANQIFETASELYPMWGDTVSTNIKGNVTFIVEDTSSDAKWYDEATPTEDGKETLKEVNLTGCELARAVKISWKLEAMSIDAFIPYIGRKMAEKMGAALGYGVSHGGGPEASKPEPMGIITALEKEASTPMITTYTAGGLTYKDVTTARGKIKGKFAAGLVIYANGATIWGEIANVLDEMGRPLFVPDTVNSNGVGRMLGITVKEDDSMEDGEILFGNIPLAYASNINKTVTIRRFEDEDNRLAKFVGYAIVDGNVLTTKGFSLLKKN